MGVEIRLSNISDDAANGLFLLRMSLNSIGAAIDNLNNPIAAISEAARQHLSMIQKTAIENSFMFRTMGLKRQLAYAKQQFARTGDIQNRDLLPLRLKLQEIRDGYFLSEQVFEYYVDILQTRSEKGMGPLLKGCDQIAMESLKQGLQPLNQRVPPVICYQDRGEGASILKAGIYLWDRQVNPAAIIKVVRNKIPLPGLTSILHESGHQAAHITNWNQEVAEILYNTVREEGGTNELATMWSSWASEIAADFWSLHQSNIASILGLYEVVAGSIERVYRIILGDPHPYGYIRMMMGLMACKLAFGYGPWDDVARVWDILYPVRLAPPESVRITNDSIALLPAICKAMSRTKIKAFSEKSLEELLPWNVASPDRVKNLLNKDLSTFSVGMNILVEKPILTLIGFRIIQLFGRRSHFYMIEEMRKWLTALGEKGIE